MPETDTRRVQIELVDAVPPWSTLEAEPVERSSPLGRVLTFAAMVAVVGSLWVFARPESGSDAADAPIDSPPTTPAPGVEPGIAPETPAPSFPLPASGLDHVIEWNGGFLATGDADTNAPGSAVLVSIDALRWEPHGWITGADRTLALERHDGGLRALTAAVGPDASTTLAVRVSVDGRRWHSEAGASEFVIPGVVRSGALRGERWVVIVDSVAPADPDAQPGGLVFTGDLDSLQLRIQFPPDEVIRSYAAIESGFVAGVTRADPSSPSGATPHLIRWTANWGLQDIGDDIGTFTSAPELIDGERLALIAGSRLFVATDAAASSWRPTLVAPADLPVLLPARAGLRIVARSDGAIGPERIAVTADGLEWRSATVAGPDPELVTISGDHAVIVAGEPARRHLLSVDLGPSRSLSEFSARRVVERGQLVPQTVATISSATDSGVRPSVEIEAKRE